MDNVYGCICGTYVGTYTQHKQMMYGKTFFSSLDYVTETRFKDKKSLPFNRYFIVVGGIYNIQQTKRNKTVLPATNQRRCSVLNI